ncbi:MAG: tetratricopeptide repeat protein [Bacteroidales bacterium]|nr:tetratricopeptide repeat protein [Bacteroidales bacterium]
MKRIILRPVAVLAAMLMFAGLNVQAQDLTAAIKLIKSEQYDQAAAMLQQLVQKEPANSRNYFYLGENALADYFADTISNSLTVSAKTAKDFFQKGVTANANDPLNYVGLAKVAFFLDDNKTADEMRAKAKSFLLPYKNIKKIVPAAPEYSFTLAKIAESYIKDAKVDTAKALPLIREAIKIDSKNADVYLIAGDIYILIPDGSKAIASYNQAQFADPKSPTAAMKIGFIYTKGRALQAAIPYFEEAITLDPAYAPAYRELGQLYSSAGRFEQSKQYFEKYLELTAGNIPAKTKYVNALFYAKDYDGVVKTVEEIFQVDKSRTYMNRIAGYSCYEKTPPDYEKALYYMDELFKNVAPDRILTKDYIYLARILVKKNINSPKVADEAIALKAELDKEKARLAATSNAAEKAKIKAKVDEMTPRAEKLEQAARQAGAEVDRAFATYGKLMELKPGDRSLLNEVAAAYNSFRRYYGVAKTLSKMLGPLPEAREDYMQVGRAYYNGERYQAADSIFEVVLAKSPEYVPAYLWIARTYSKMDPDTKLGLAKPKFEKLIKVAESDSVKYQTEMVEAFGYLGYYHMMTENWQKSKDYYNRMANIDPNNKDNRIKGYSYLGSVELRSTSSEKTNEGRLPYLSRAAEAYSKVLAIDPNNASAKSQLAYIRDFEAAIIEIPQGSEVLLISAKGYKTQEIPITKSRVYNVTLVQ